MPKEIQNWNDIPDSHEYYSTLSGESFMLIKDEDFIIFQSPSLVKLHLKYPDQIFCDGNFYIAQSISYQVFITRIYAKEYIIYCNFISVDIPLIKFCKNIFL